MSQNKELGLFELTEPNPLVVLSIDMENEIFWPIFRMRAVGSGTVEFRIAFKPLEINIDSSPLERRKLLMPISYMRCVGIFVSRVLASFLNACLPAVSRRFGGCNHIDLDEIFC